MKFNYGKIFILGSGYFGLSAIWVTYNSFVPIFLQERFFLTPSGIGFYMTLDNIAALFLLPFFGAWSDRVNTPIGRRIPFITAGIPVAAAAFFLVPAAEKLPLFAASTITLILSMSIWRTPVMALLADITPSPHRSQANGIINFMGGIGGVTAAVAGGILFAANQSYPFWMGGGLLITAGIILFFFIKEPAEIDRIEQEKPGLKAGIKKIYESPDKNVLRLFVAHFLWIIALSSIEAFFTLYAKNHLGFTGDYSSRILGFFPLMLIITAIPAGFIGGKTGRKPAILSGLTLMGTTLLAIFLLKPEILAAVIITLPLFGPVPIVGIMLMICGSTWMLVNVNSIPMIFDMAGKNETGTYTGLCFFSVTAAAIAGPNINGWIVELTGNNYSSIFITASVFILFAFIIMTGVKEGEAKL